MHHVALALFGNDLRLPPNQHEFWSRYPNLTDVLFLEPSRSNKCRSGWQSRTLKLLHSDVGGSSNASVHIHHWYACAQGVSLVDVFRPPLHLPARRLLTLLDPVVGGPSKPAPLPSVKIAVTPVVISQTAVGRRCYDSQGLIPVGSSFDTLFLVPSALTRTKWTIRSLTPRELLLSVDFPTSWVSQLTGAVGIAIWKIAAKAPLKVLASAANTLLADRGIRPLTLSRRGFYPTVSKVLDHSLVV